jgi:hypothetical protein
MELHEWWSGCRQDAQVISVTSAWLPALVECGRFHEGLFYRLNVVSLTATVGDSRAIARPDARSQMHPTLRSGGTSAIHQSIGAV